MLNKYLVFSHLFKSKQKMDTPTRTKNHRSRNILKIYDMKVVIFMLEC